jgi:predicted GIY-YIG superfamily endonuclease
MSNRSICHDQPDYLTALSMPPLPASLAPQNCHQAQALSRLQKSVLASPAKAYWIYALADPTTQTVRYIGQTKALRQRYSCHACGSDSNDRVRKWILTLRAQGLRPLFLVLELTNKEDAIFREYVWIRRYRSSGNLLNAMMMRKAKGRPNAKKHYYQIGLDTMLS